MGNYNKVIQKVRDLFHEQKEFIPLHIPHFSGNEKKYVLECIDSTYVSSVGQFVNDFEQSIADFTGAKRCIVCVNGTNAIHLALVASGVEAGDEVITQPLTFIATVNAISYAHAIPIFVDVDKDTMGMSPLSLLKFLEENTIVKDNTCINKSTGKKIRACLPMHTFGHAARIDEIKSICDKHHIILIEDAAEAIGSSYKGKSLGTFGLMGTFSFNGNKTITTGGGGAVITDDEDLADKLKHLSTQAKIPHKWNYVHDQVGYNYRMPNLNAALGLAQMENLEFILIQKRKLASAYQEFFSSSDMNFFEERADEKSNFWLNAVILENNEQQQTFLTELNEAGVMCRPIWELMTEMVMFKDCQKTNLDNATWLSQRVVNIPSSVVE